MTETTPPPDQSAALAQETAAAIQAAFVGFREAFQTITHKAKDRFEHCDWQQVLRDAEERLDQHGRFVAAAVTGLRDRLDGKAGDLDFWTAVKQAHCALSAGEPDCDIAETFYNSVTMRTGPQRPLNPAIEYMGGENDPPAPDDSAPVYTHYPADSDTPALVRAILSDYRFQGDETTFDANVERVAASLTGYLAGQNRTLGAVEMAKPVFYRGKGAYLVGRLCLGDGYTPLALAFLHTDAVRVDAVLHTEDEVSIIFSFARSYFHVEVEMPRAMVWFLKSLMPRKPISELYTSIGYNKHGKTELYRALMLHLKSSDDQFVRAPGERGMVMMVFTLQNYDVVFKIIKDSFDPPKQTTRRDVMRRYGLVFRHDKGGRLVDAQEFEQLRFDKARFAPDLLAELLEVGSNTIMLDGEMVVIKHLYTERRIEPLNLYLLDADPDEAREIVIEYGQAIKDLAATNIFPGDILLKNFGVTRHGRVIFYDYDELCLLDECNFREMPEPDLDDDWSSEPAFYVGENDVFPSEMSTFLGLPPALRPIFIEHHQDLFGTAFWRTMQARHKAGEVIDVLPYKESQSAMLSGQRE